MGVPPDLLLLYTRKKSANLLYSIFVRTRLRCQYCTVCTLKKTLLGRFTIADVLTQQKIEACMKYL